MEFEDINRQALWSVEEVILGGIYFHGEECVVKNAKFQHTFKKTCTLKFVAVKNLCYILPKQNILLLCEYGF